MKKIITAITLISILANCGGQTQNPFATITPIEEILKTPTKFENRKIKVKGFCTESFNLFGVYTSYTISDGTNKLYVKTKRKISPVIGQEIEATGLLKELFSFDNNAKLIVLIEE